MNVLIVHAHHEPKSFCSALHQQAARSLIEAGHEVVVSDLSKMDFDPVSDRRNFSTRKEAGYLKQQVEETYASENDGFAADIEAEIIKLEKCDAIIFCFPLWWFGMPAILKGWCDRVLAMGRIYGGSKLYEGGTGKAQKRGLILMTTGGGPTAYDGWGLNPSLDTILKPIQHGVFWFNGFLPLEPFVAWSPVRVSDARRATYLSELDLRMKDLFTEAPIQLPPMSDFPNWGHDSKSRYVVVATRNTPVDEKFLSDLPDGLQTITTLQRNGIVLDFSMTDGEDPTWKAFLKMRGTDKQEIIDHLNRLPISDDLEFQVSRISPPSAKPA